MIGADGCQLASSLEVDGGFAKQRVGQSDDGDEKGGKSSILHLARLEVHQFQMCIQ